MKKKFLILIALIAFNLLLNAQQVPNGGFETWTNSNKPDGWYTFSSSSSIINLASKNTADKYEGSASAKIQTGIVNSSEVYEILSLGNATWTFTGGYTYYPVYFPFRPDTMLFAYKYNSPGADFATAYIKLSKGKTTLIETELTLEKTAQWSFPSIILTPLYSAADIPDSLLIQFKSSKTRSNFFGIEGSTLNVDKVHFGYTSLSTSTPDLEGYFRLIPNPFSTQLTVILSGNESATISLYDIQGRQKLRRTFTNSTTINTEHLEDGIFFYKLMTSMGTLKTGKVFKQ